MAIQVFLQREKLKRIEVNKAEEAMLKMVLARKETIANLAEEQWKKRLAR